MFIIYPARNRLRLSDSEKEAGAEYMDNKQIKMIRFSFGKVSFEAFADIFYTNYTSIQPSLRLVFPDDLGRRREQLRLMIGAGLGMLSDSVNAVPALEQSGRRYALNGVREEHYRTIGAALIDSLREVNEPDDEAEAVWTSHFDAMSEIMKRGARSYFDSPDQIPAYKNTRGLNAKF
ncbi:MAG: hypothetical protein IPJ30_16515 [Acidobacteria bacterium]|nr:hypothetical protein [Acidobacteriota bacterium]